MANVEKVSGWIGGSNVAPKSIGALIQELVNKGKELEDMVNRIVDRISNGEEMSASEIYKVGVDLKNAAEKIEMIRIALDNLFKSWKTRGELLKQI